MGVGRAQRVVAQARRVQGVHHGLLALLAALVLKKILQQGSALICQQAALHCRLVVQARLRKQVDHRASGAGFGVGRAEHDTVKPRVQNSAAAHGAGLQRHEQRAAVQPVVAQRLAGRAQSGDLGMGRGVVPANGRVAAGCDDPAIFHQDRADRHLARAQSVPGLGQRELHEINVVHNCYIYSS